MEKLIMILVLIADPEVRKIILILIILGMAPIGVTSKITEIGIVVQIRVLIDLLKKRFIDRLGRGWLITS